jgi:hypothetical protein
MSDSDVEVNFIARLENLFSGIGEAKEHIVAFGEEASNLTAIFSEVGEAIAVAFAVEKIAAFAEKMADLGLQTERASIILGMPAEKIGGMKLIAEASGQSLESLSMAFARLSRNVLDQTPNAKRALDALGISFGELKNKSATDQLGIFADKFAGIENGATKDAIAMELFGRAGVRMLPMLNEGAEGIAKWNDIAARSGDTISKEVLPKFKEMHWALVEFGAAMEGSSIAIFLKFQGVLVGATKYINDMIEAFTSAVNTSPTLGFAIGVIVAGFRSLEVITVTLTNAWYRLFQSFDLGVEVIGTSFETFYNIVVDSFKAILENAAQFFGGLVTAAKEAVTVIGTEFVDLASVIANAMTGHLWAASNAFTKMGTDGSDALGKIKSALSGAVAGNGFSAVAEDVKKGSDKIAQYEKDFGTKWVADNKQYVDEVSAIFGIGEEKKKQVALRAAQLAPKASAKTGSADLSEFTLELDAIQNNAKVKRELLDEALKNHAINQAEWLAQTKSVLGQEYNAEKETYDKELLAAKLTTAQKETILRELQKAHEKYLDEVRKAEFKTHDEIVKKWQDGIGKISNAFGSALKSMVTGSTTPFQALLGVMNTLASDAIDWAVKMAEVWVVKEVTKTATSQTEGATRIGLAAGEAAASKASQDAQVIGAVTAYAGETYAGVAAFLSPFMGPAALGPAAAAESTVLGVGLGGVFDTGSWSVPSDMVAGVHKGEMIIPQRGGVADEFRSFMGGKGGMGGQKGDVHLHVHALDAPSFVSYLKNNGRDLAKIVSNQFDNNPSTRPTH